MSHKLIVIFGVTINKSTKSLSCSSQRVPQDGASEQLQAMLYISLTLDSWGVKGFYLVVKS